MLGNRAIQVSLAKNDNKTPSEQRQIDRDDVVYWNSVLIANAERLGKGLVALYAAKKAIDTASAVILKMTPVA